MNQKKSIFDGEKHIQKVVETENKKKESGKCLNLGCGSSYIEGYINLDHNKKVKPDIVHNLNNYPYPFKNEEFDYIYASHILEHIEDLFKCLRELERIIKSGGIIHIRVPHFSSYLAYTDLSHKRFFGIMTFEQIIKGEYSELGCFPNFKIVHRKINFLSVPHKFLNKFFGFFLNNLNPYIYERFFCWIFPVNEIEIKLKVTKKAGFIK